MFGWQERIESVEPATPASATGSSATGSNATASSATASSATASNATASNATASSATASGASVIGWGRSRISKTRSKLISAVSTSTGALDRAASGEYAVSTSAAKATTSPTDMVPESTNWPPTR